MYDCPRNYTLSDVNASAARWVEGDRTVGMHLAMLATRAHDLCSGNGRGEGYLKHGGWCLEEKGSQLVHLPNEQSYRLPRHHARSDGIVVAALAAILSGALAGSCGSRYPSRLSLIDFGAGVGQYGHSLLSLNPALRWRGYDGAGNAVDYTNRFVSFVDLTVPLAFPRADWVAALEVGEHVHYTNEMMFIRNLHAHNCRGVVLSWAKLNQWGLGHVNNHAPAYVAGVFEGLGYRYSQALSDALRKGAGVEIPQDHNATKERYFWFRRPTVAVFERITPLQSPECTPCI